MKKITLLISAMALFMGVSIAQNNAIVGSAPMPVNASTSPAAQRSCGTMEGISQQELENLEDAFAPQVAAYLQAQANGGTPEAQYTIPVIVHIIHNSNESVGQGRNVAYARVTEQIQTLNDDFGKTNSDAGNAPAVFQAVAADFEIDFCLVTKYPTGHPMAGQTLAEVGVDRVDATTIGMSNTTSGYSMNLINQTLKPATSWNPNEVMNIWVCQISGGILGYAQFPNSGAANTDGVVTLYSAFGITSGAYGLGRTTTHEVGHWVNLRHIWGDANCGNDQVADTPTQQTSNFSCPSHPSATCGNSGDMFMNYMDYVNDNCMVMFTAGQKARAQSTMASAPRRSTLNGASATLCGAGALTANFSESATTINVGQTITFTDASSGPNTITSYSWDFDVANLGGVAPGTANTVGTHTVTYSNAGTYSVSLTVGDGSTTDTRTKTSYITVNPAGTVVCDSTAANWDLATHAATTGNYYWNAGGWVLGQNNLGENGWADKITYSTSGMELTDVFFYFGSAVGTSSINYKVWGENAGAPNNANIMAQQSIAISALGTGGTPTLWSLTTPATLNGNFFIGFDHPTLIAGDSASLMSASTGSNSCWANGSSGWIDLSTKSLDHGVALIPVICNKSTGEKEILGNLQDIYIFPNPSKGSISVALPSKIGAAIEVYNIIGDLIYTNHSVGSTQLVTIDINNQPNGVYFVKVKSGNQITTKKVILAK